MSTCDVDVFSSIAETNPEELKRLILNDLKRPVIFKNRIDSWATPQKWSPSSVCSLLHDTTTTFEVCPKQNTLAFTEQFKHNEPVFESQCGHIEATLGNFCEWLDHHPEVKRDSSPPQAKQARIAPVNPLLSYPRSQYWIYADYKYMSQLCPQSELLTAVDWSVFGFPGRDGRESTMWIGSEGASTPCHYDTYGCNLVAQLWGKKRWTLASPTQSRGMYPTRTPYEESSVFSQVNVDSPDLDKYPDFKTVTLHKAVLEPGDVLLVPRQWWHFVECLEPSVSINTWLELPEDHHERVKEAIVRILVSALVTPATTADLVNPNEVLFPIEDNVALLGHARGKPLTVRELMASVTRNNVIDCIANNLYN